MTIYTYTLDVSSKNIYVDVKINDISSVQVLSTAPLNQNKNVSLIVINNTNLFSVDVALPLVDDRVDGETPFLNVKLKRSIFGAADSEETIGEFTLDTDLEKLNEKRLTVLSTEFIGQAPLPYWSWQNASKIDLNVSEYDFKAFGKMIYDWFSEKKTVELVKIQQLKLNELALATEQVLDEVLDDVDWTYNYLFDQDWALLPLNIEDIKIRLQAGGRLAHIVRRDNSPLIQSVPPAKPFSFDFRAMYNINGANVNIVIGR